MPEKVRSAFNNTTKYSIYELEEICFTIKSYIKAYLLNT